MKTSITASVVSQNLKTLTVKKDVVVSILENTASVEAASNIIASMVGGFYLEDIQNMLAEIEKGLTAIKTKFPVMVVESVRYCGDMEILETKEIDFVNDKVVIYSHNAKTEVEMTEKDFDTYTAWIADLKKVFK